MGGCRPCASDGCSDRRWTFADCRLDEADWSLIVSGRRVPIESKPMELLRELLIHAGSVVTKDELLDRIWHDVTVVEASLPTAVHKVRLAIGDTDRQHPLIETVPGIGYRFAAAVALDVQPSVRNGPAFAAAPGSARLRRWVAASLVLGMAALITLVPVGPALVQPRQLHAAANPSPLSRRDELLALRNLDIGAVRRMIAVGWNPDLPMDGDGNGAINLALEICEWNPDHDRQKLLMLVRVLADEGASLKRRNKWGDTPYSIAAAPRYCGPDHPVTRMIRATCNSGSRIIDPTCLASYPVRKG